MHSLLAYLFSVCQFLVQGEECLPGKAYPDTASGGEGIALDDVAIVAADAFQSLVWAALWTLPVRMRDVSKPFLEASYASSGRFFCATSFTHIRLPNVRQPTYPLACQQAGVFTLGWMASECLPFCLFPSFA